MSRDPYRSSGDHLAYGPPPERWDATRFNREKSRDRFQGRGRGEEDRFERSDTRVTFSHDDRGGSSFGGGRDRSVDEVYERERRGPRGYEDEYERRHYHDEGPRFEREQSFGRQRGQSITIEKERERYEDPPRRGGNRPAFLRRQSSLDTFDRKPLIRFSDRERVEDYGRFEREEYGPPSRYERREELRPAPLTPIPLPVKRQLGPPPRKYVEKEYYEDIKVAEPDFYGDDEFRGYPERVREREIIRRRRRSRSKESRASRSARESVRGSVRSSSRSSSSSSSSRSIETVRNEFPKRGKTRMPSRLVNKKAIIALGYPYEEEGDTIIIMKALGRENIDEVIKLSEEYKVEKHEMSGGRSQAGEEIIEERRTEVITVPAPPVVHAPPPQQYTETIKDTKIVDVRRSPSPAYSHRSHGHHHHAGPIVVDAGPRDESTFVERRREVYERSDPIPVGPLALAIPAHRPRNDERAIRAEIKALEAEKEALRAQKRADREMRRADRYRGEGRVSQSELVVYDHDRYDNVDGDMTVIRTEKYVEPDGGVRIQKDRKGPPPKVIRAMLKTLT